MPHHVINDEHEWPTIPSISAKGTEQKISLTKIG